MCVIQCLAPSRSYCKYLSKIDFIASQLESKEKILCNRKSNKDF